MPYSPEPATSVIIDDLDPGFKVIERKKDNGLRIAVLEDKKRNTDQGLPVTRANRIPQDWSRIEDPESYGKYRHTLVLVGAGEGEKEAVFTANIKNAGKWDLELYIPSRRNIISILSWNKDLMPGKRIGAYDLIITDGNGNRHEIKFDPKTAPQGWNLAGNIDLPEGKTTVTISDKTDGDYVVADAVRWSPSAGNQ